MNRRFWVYYETKVFRLDDIFKDATNVVPTKRNILSVISTVYDPVGYLQPFTIQLKILFQ